MIKHSIEDYHFFWKGPLSQWSKTEFDAMIGTTQHWFRNCEQYMMAIKAWLFADYTTMGKILEIDDPAKVKALGREVADFDSKVWDSCKLQVVTTGNAARWRCDRGFRNALEATGNKVLVEASPFDRVWGIGYEKTNAYENFDTWGENLLGQALMQVREDHRSTN